MAENYIQMLIDSLKKKEHILSRLIELNDEQNELIKNEEFDGDAFTDNVDSKDELIVELIKLDDGFNNVFNRVKDELEGHKEAYAAQIKETQQHIRQVTELAAKVETQESHNKALLEQKFSTMRKQIQTAKRSTKMANTYYQNMNKLNYEPQFMDKKK